ncbi:YceH family protein [Pseudomonas matsuisoli]|uniref:UPF0502 protein n=1 Tax=Pseudomonas matsuisoli TaxID=1515666 RepID=A0A917Q2B1_9PSED|nr:DUF480 domain-containing protein [Pseudomonas matsuisoli]GGK06868.1 UPF0502 protein [Pseudomonas matsuisoli]
MTDEKAVPFHEDPLTAVQLRVLGCLIEKQLTTPESYPLTLNAVLLAANQKTSREPVMNIQQGEAGMALRQLEERGLVRLVMGNRADRWEQRAEKTLGLVAPQVVLLGLLLLRGPQTLGELLTRSSRMHAFEGTDDVRHQLERLASRGLATLLPRQSGQREERFMHALGGPIDIDALAMMRSDGSGGSKGATNNDRIEQLEARITDLEARLLRLEEALN